MACACCILQCHFGRDSLILAQRGGRVVGIDFSGPAIAAARNLAAELGLGERARFVEANLYAAPSAVAEPGSFDLAFVTWAAINWLPDTRRWAEIVAWFLQPGGALYLAEGHPIALVLDDAAPGYGDMPGWYVPYFHREPLVFNDPADYANEAARLQNARTYEWIHPLGEIVSGLLDAGLALRWLHEHESVPWRMFKVLVQDVEGMYRWPFSLRAKRSS
jgi:SAM-dependent methyltransferase